MHVNAIVVSIIISISLGAACSGGSHHPVTASPATTPSPTAAPAGDPHATTVDNLVGAWQGKAIGTPFGDFPFAIAFDREPSGDVHGRLEAGPGRYLDFRFHRELPGPGAGAGRWVLLESGALPGVGTQSETLAPVAGTPARWTDGDPAHLAVTLAVDAESMLWTTTIEDKPHALFQLARARGELAERIPAHHPGGSAAGGERRKVRTMVRCDLEWRGLWHPMVPGRLRDELIVRAIVYFVTPLAIALLFGEFHSLDQLANAYGGAFIAGSSIGGCFEVLYRVGWARALKRRPSWALRIMGHVATIPVAVGGGTLIANAIGTAFLGWHDNDLLRLYLQGIVISAAIITILVTADEANGRAQDASRREATHRMTVIRAELAALQARTDPHFLFNSLNTVAALIPDDPELAETLLLRLAAVFRYALDAGRKGSVALAEEIAAVTAYLEVEALRLGSRLSWRLDRDAGLEAVQVPPLVLQPLVENAIRHGAGARRGSTAIVVTARRRDGELVLAVEDQGEPGDSAPTQEGSGTALADLRARLALAFPERARLDAGAAPPAGWRAEVVMPLERAE